MGQPCLRCWHNIALWFVRLHSVWRDLMSRVMSSLVCKVVFYICSVKLAWMSFLQLLYQISGFLCSRSDIGEDRCKWRGWTAHIVSQGLTRSGVMGLQDYCGFCTRMTDYGAANTLWKTVWSCLRGTLIDVDAQSPMNHNCHCCIPVCDDNLSTCGSNLNHKAGSKVLTDWSRAWNMLEGMVLLLRQT
jgi:hypothetical protein